MSNMYPTDVQFGSTLWRTISLTAPAQTTSVGGWEIGDLETFAGTSGPNAFFANIEPRRETPSSEFYQYLSGWMIPIYPIQASRGNGWVYGPFKGVAIITSGASIEWLSVTSPHGHGRIEMNILVVPIAPDVVDIPDISVDYANKKSWSYAFLTDTLATAQATTFTTDSFPRTLGTYDAADHYIYVLQQFLSDWPQAGVSPSRSSDVHYRYGSGTHFGGVTIVQNPVELANTPYEYAYTSAMAVDFTRVQRIRATAQVAATATAVKLEAIPGLPAALKASAVASPSASALLYAKIQLASLAASSAWANLNLYTMQFVHAAAAAVASAPASLTTHIKLAAAPAAQAASSGALTTKIVTKAVVAALASVVPALTARIKLRATALVSALSTGQIVTGIRPAAAAAGQASVMAAMTTKVTLAAIARSQSSAWARLHGEVAMPVSSCTTQCRVAVYNFPTRTSAFRSP